MSQQRDDETLTTGPAAGQGASPGQTRTLSAVGAGATLTRTGGEGASEVVGKVDWQVGDVVDGKYEVTAELGRGGMGTVYKVHHREWDIDLAVKMPLAALVGDEASKARFIREAQTWVDLGLHPNIVQCWYVRELGSIPRVFADYMPGGSLKDWAREGKVKPGEWGKIIDLVIQACDGLGYAHERGVVHRDVKPANMLMTEEGELRVTDFGLVKVAGAAEIEGGGVGASSGAHTLTVTGSSMGTPEYGAPEQWGDAKSVDARADIYALGIVLFELCVGRRPFDDGRHGEPAHVVIGRHLSMPAPDARELNKEVPEALASLIARCLAKAPGGRPASMAALRTDLEQAHLRAVGEAYTRAAPKAAALQADAHNNHAVSLWDLGDRQGALAMWAQALKLDGQHAEAVYNKSLVEWRSGKTTDAEAVNAVSGAKRANRRSGVYLGYLHLHRAAAAEAEAALTEALADADTASDGAAWRALGDALMAQEKYGDAKSAYAKVLERLPGDPQSLRNLEMAAASTRGEDFPWWRCVRSFEGHAGRANAVAIHPDGRYAVSGSEDNTIKVWDLESGQCVRTLEGHSEAVKGIAIDPDGRRLVSASKDKSIRVWDLQTGQWQSTFTGHQEAVNAVAVHPDGERFVSASEDNSLVVWSLENGYLRSLNGHAGAVKAVAIHPDGQYVVSAAHDGELKIWDLQTGRCLRTLEGHSLWADAVAVTRDGRTIVSGGADKQVKVWDFATGKCLRVLEGHRVPVHAVAILPDARRIVSGSMDGTLRVWDLSTGVCLCTFEVKPVVIALATHPDGIRVVSGTSDNTVRLWSVPGAPERRALDLLVCRQHGHSKTEQLHEQFAGHLDRAKEALVSTNVPDAYQALASARGVPGFSRDPEALALNAHLGTMVPAKRLRDWWFVRRLAENEGLHAITMHPDGRRIISGNWNENGHGVAIWEIATGKVLARLVGHSKQVNAVAVCGNGRNLVSAGEDGIIRIWDIEKGKSLHRIEGDGNPLHAIGVYPDGRHMVVGHGAGMLSVWDTATGRLLRKFEGYEESVHEVAVHPDGARAVSCSLWNRTIKLWDLETGRCLRTFEGHEEGMSSVAFCPDGRSVLSASWDHTLKLWDLDTGRCLRTLEGHTHQVEALAVASSSRRAASWSNDRNLRVWNVETGECLCTLQVPEVTASTLAMTPDGRFLISGSTDGMRLWEFDWELDASGRFGAPAPASAESAPSRPVAVPAPPAVEARLEACSFCGTRVPPDKIYLRSSKASLCQECSALCLDLLNGRAPKDANGLRHGPKAPAGGNTLACSFCGQKTYEMLIAGPGVYACDACIDAGKPVASPPPEPAPRPERIVRAPAPPVSTPPEKRNPVEALRIPAWKINKAMETPALRAAIDGIAGATGIAAKEVCALMLVSAELDQKLPDVLRLHQHKVMYVEEHLGDFRYMLA